MSAGHACGVMSATRAASLLLFVVSAGLLLGALGFQYLGGLAPCEMCYWQRWGHVAVLAAAAVAFVGNRRPLGVLAVVVMLVAAGLGAYHAGVELKWWQGVTACTAPVGGGLSTAEMMDALLRAPLVRCDSIPWSLFGISMAGWNALISAGAALLALLLLKAKRIGKQA